MSNNWSGGAETVEHEAEAIEHHLEPETLRVFSKLVRFWRAQPSRLQEFPDCCRRR
jgi:Mn-dependent DtxR family transcriptional regulator